MYLNYEQQLSKLTLKQRSVVENTNVVSPIRIDGPAGTGKTASMILRAYFLLKNARAKAEPFSIVFFAHSESTKCEIESAFSLLENADSFLSEKSSQHIMFTTLFAYCIKTIRVNSSQVIEHDANINEQHVFHYLALMKGVFLKIQELVIFPQITLSTLLLTNYIWHHPVLNTD